MKALELTILDKSKWERGEWDNEPDKIQFQDEDTKLPCLMVRTYSHWCGYVGVTKGHPFFEKDATSFNEETISLATHGGITFNGFCSPEEHKEPKICHVVENGEDDKVWWFGFDCAHSGDYRPATDDFSMRINQRHKMPIGYETYKNIAYVKAEIKSLAKQLFEAGKEAVSVKST